MTIEIEAGASQRQCSMKPGSEHEISVFLATFPQTAGVPQRTKRKANSGALGPPEVASTPRHRWRRG